MFTLILIIKKKLSVNYALIKYLCALMYTSIKQKRKQYAILKTINDIIENIKHNVWKNKLKWQNKIFLAWNTH